MIFSFEKYNESTNPVFNADWFEKNIDNWFLRDSTTRTLSDGYGFTTECFLKYPSYTIEQLNSYLSNFYLAKYGGSENYPIALEYVQNRVIKILEENPSIYDKCKTTLSKIMSDEKIPNWIKRGGDILWGMKTEKSAGFVYDVSYPKIGDLVRVLFKNSLDKNGKVYGIITKDRTVKTQWDSTTPGMSDFQILCWYNNKLYTYNIITYGITDCVKLNNTQEIEDLFNKYPEDINVIYNQLPAEQKQEFKHLKRSDNLLWGMKTESVKSESNIRLLIKNAAYAYTWKNGFKAEEECSFAYELAILFHKQDIESWGKDEITNNGIKFNNFVASTKLYDALIAKYPSFGKLLKNISLEEFTKIYEVLYAEAKATILKEIEKDPNQYFKWKAMLDLVGIKAPNWIDRGKDLLWNMKTNESTTEDFKKGDIVLIKTGRINLNKILSNSTIEFIMNHDYIVGEIVNIYNNCDELGISIHITDSKPSFTYQIALTPEHFSKIEMTEKGITKLVTEHPDLINDLDFHMSLAQKEKFKWLMRSKDLLWGMKTNEANRTTEDIVHLIRSIVSDVTYGVESYLDFEGDIDDCPFAAEIAILYQKDYIENLYYKGQSEWYTDLGDTELETFQQVYRRLIPIAKREIINEIEKEPTLYIEWGQLIEDTIGSNFIPLEVKIFCG